MEKQLDYIFIDTSVFQSEAFFKKDGRISRLFNLAKEGRIAILMPEITRREWLKHFKDNTKQNFTEILKKASYIGTDESESFVYDQKKMEKSYDNMVEQSFEHHLVQANVIIISISYAKNNLESIIDKYFNKEKPFGINGKNKEFPDAFILASLEAYAREKQIDSIKVFSKDKDIVLYNDKLFVQSNVNDFLNNILKEREEKDIARLCNYIDNNLINYENQIKSNIEEFLSDGSIYFNRFNCMEINDVIVNDIKMDKSNQKIELLSIDEDTISIWYFIDVEADVQVSHFCEEESIWDPEEKQYLYESYNNTNIHISSSIKIIFEMYRIESEADQSISVEIKGIDTDDLQDVIDDDHHKYIFG